MVIYVECVGIAGGYEVHIQGRTELHSEHRRPVQEEVLDMASHLSRHNLEKGKGIAVL